MPSEEPLLITYTDKLLLEFLAGIFIGVLYLRGVALNSILAGAVIAASIVLFVETWTLYRIQEDQVTADEDRFIARFILFARGKPSIRLGVGLGQLVIGHVAGVDGPVKIHATVVHGFVDIIPFLCFHTVDRCALSELEH